MNGVQIFERPEFGQIRVVEGEGKNPWFVAKDVAKILGYQDTDQSIRKHCKHAELFKPVDSTGLGIGPRGVIIIPESDLYRLIMRSNLPNAEQFQDWVVEEVLPSIRSHGGYLTPEKVEEALLNPDTIIRLATELKREREAKAALQAQAEIDRPKALFADSVAASSTSVLIGDLAKILRQNGVDIGQKRLFEWLRENGYLIKFGSSWNMPTQRSMDMELFQVKESTVNNPDGTVRITKTTKVTGKGQVYFVNKFLGGNDG